MLTLLGDTPNSGFPDRFRQFEKADASDAPYFEIIESGRLTTSIRKKGYSTADFVCLRVRMAGDVRQIVESFRRWRENPTPAADA